MINSQPEVSLVVPCHDEAANLSTLYGRVRAVMDESGKSWEMVCINDGSKDDTLERLLTLHEKDPRIVVIDLSRNFGKEAALTAGLDYARGECAIPLDADLQDPPELIPVLLAKGVSDLAI
ncbi:glycosyltransferase family 2 protein [Acidithiobacillus caldus]|uniref:glycosyltransferase family 2 protein n=1 Tax=Acidithiobacillus caldus TaxID=33059 RepID=UPI001D023FC6|nr:glycosyltransferase family 2 protein [Acidithiobacillus caldus]